MKPLLVRRKHYERVLAERDQYKKAADYLEARRAWNQSAHVKLLCKKSELMHHRAEVYFRACVKGDKGLIDERWRALLQAVDECKSAYGHYAKLKRP